MEVLAMTEDGNRVSDGIGPIPALRGYWLRGKFHRAYDLRCDFRCVVEAWARHRWSAAPFEPRINSCSSPRWLVCKIGGIVRCSSAADALA